MNLSFVSHQRSLTAVAALLLGIATAEYSYADAPAVSKSTTKTKGPTSASTNAPTRGGVVIDGERMTVRTIADTLQGGMPVGVLIVPESWSFKSQVTWNYEQHSSPVKLAAAAENPENEEAFYAFPALEFFCLRPASGYYRPGQNVGGLLFAERQSPAQTLLGFVRQTRGSFPRFEVIGTKELPGLAEALQMLKADNQRGLGLKITYELRGKPVEEEFYAVAYSIDIPYDGPQGRTWQNNWGLYALHSFRARSGTLERRRPVFAATAKSFRPNPMWQERKVAIFSMLAEQFNRQLQAGYDSIAAAGRLSRQISANNDAMLAGIDRQLAASRATRSESAGRSANDKFSDYIRGVDTVNDPYYGTSQHASTEQYHWTDGYGSYRHSNDPTADPNRTEVGSWQLLETAR